MLRFEVEPETLAALLASFGAPRVRGVRCERVGVLLLHLAGVDTRIEVLGGALPRIDLSLAVRARAVSAALIELRFELRDVAGLGSFAARLLPRATLAKQIVSLLTDRLDLEQGVEVHEDGTARVFLDRLRSPSRPILARLRCERFDVPGPAGLAISAAFRLEAGGAP